MPIWATPITATTQIRQTSLVNMLVAAINERVAIPTGFGYSIPALASGDPVAKAGLWGNKNVPSFGIPGSLGIQGAIGQMLGYWVDHTAPIGGSSSYSFWTLPNLRAAAGLPTVYSYSGNTSNAATENVWLRNNGFRKRRLRQFPTGEVTTIAQRPSFSGINFDIHGNAAIPGQRAYCVSQNNPGYDYPLSQTQVGFQNNVYLCTAPGVWKLDNSGWPDVLDNTLAPPNTVASSITSLAFSGTLQPETPYFLEYMGGGDSTDVFGLFQPGDIYDYYMPEECRQIINLLRWTNGGNLTFSGAGHGVSVSVSGYGSAAAAESAATAAYLAATPGGGSTPGATASLSFSAGAGTYGATLAKATARYRALVSPTGAAKKYFLYARGLPPAGTGTTYDAEGDGATNGVWTLLDSSPAPFTSPTEPVSAELLGNIATAPPNFPGAVGTAGYQLDSPFMILKYNVGGTSGFQYCTVTD